MTLNDEIVTSNIESKLPNLLVQLHPHESFVGTDSV